MALRCSDPVAARHPAGGATESTHEPVSVLGIGAMGHGMTTSALRAGIRTIVWNRNPAPTRDLAALGAEVAETAADAGRLAAIVVTMVRDTDAVISIARDQACSLLSLRVRSGPDEHHRRGGNRMRGGSSGCRASRRDASRRARFRKQRPCRARSVDEVARWLRDAYDAAS